MFEFEALIAEWVEFLLAQKQDEYDASHARRLRVFSELLLKAGHDDPSSVSHILDECTMWSFNNLGELVWLTMVHTVVSPKDKALMICGALIVAHRSSYNPIYTAQALKKASYESPSSIDSVMQTVIDLVDPAELPEPYATSINTIINQMFGSELRKLARKGV